MAVIEEILQSISDHIINSSVEWRDIPIFYHRSEVNPNNDVPCIIVEAKGINGKDESCFIENTRNIEISLYMDEEDSRVALRKVWSFEEDILEPFKDKFFILSLNDNISSFKYKGTSDIQTLEVKEEKDSPWEFLARFITVTFELKYNI